MHTRQGSARIIKKKVQNINTLAPVAIQRAKATLTDSPKQNAAVIDALEVEAVTPHKRHQLCAVALGEKILCRDIQDANNSKYFPQTGPTHCKYIWFSDFMKVVLFGGHDVLSRIEL